MRVAARRFMAGVRMFREHFPEPEFEELRRAARRVLKQLGAVRDLDVLVEYWERKPGGEQETGLALAYLGLYLRRQRDKARRPMLEALDRFEQRGFPSEVSRFFDAAGGDEQSGPSFRAAAAVALPQRLHELLGHEPCVHDPAAETEQHQMRIAAKWMRYTMELFAPAFKDELKRPIRQMRRLQDELGELHDCDVRRELIRDLLSQRLDWRCLEELSLLAPMPVERGLRLLLSWEEDSRQGLYRRFAKRWGELTRSGISSRWEAHLAAPDAPPREEAA